MSHKNFEHFDDDNDWDEFPEESYWNEHEWRNYLKESDNEIAKFLSIYDLLKDQPDHFEKIATKMGWDVEDITAIEEYGLFESDEEEEEGDNDIKPYTALNNPVIVVTHALYNSLRQIWENYLNQNPDSISPKLCWNYANSLHEAETNVVFAVQAIDLGDFGLSVCHLKNSLSALNKTLSFLDKITHPDSNSLIRLLDDMKVRLFDLRELWLRVMSDCRTECNRRLDDSD